MQRKAARVFVKKHLEVLLPAWVSSMGVDPGEDEPGQDPRRRLAPSHAPSETKAIAVFVPQPPGQADAQTVGPEKVSTNQNGDAGLPLSKAEAYVFNLALAPEDAASAAPPWPAK